MPRFPETNLGGVTRVTESGCHAITCRGVPGRMEDVMSSFERGNLIVSRRIGQTVVIADEIEVTVVSVCGDKVKLVIKADRNIPVDRLEVLQRKRAELSAEIERLEREAFPEECEAMETAGAA